MFHLFRQIPQLTCTYALTVIMSLYTLKLDKPVKSWIIDDLFTCTILVFFHIAEKSGIHP